MINKAFFIKILKGFIFIIAFPVIILTALLIHSIGIKPLLIFCGIIAVLSIIAIAVIFMTIKKKGGKAYDLFGGIAAWAAMHLILYHFSPWLFEWLMDMKGWWAFEFLLILVGIVLLGRAFSNPNIAIIRTFYVLLLIVTIADVFFHFTAVTSRWRIQIDDHFRILRVADVRQEITDTYKNNRAKELVKKGKSINSAVKQGRLTDPNQNLELKEFDKSIQSSPLQQPKKERVQVQTKPAQRQRIEKVFDIPAGNGKNEDANLFDTKLDYQKGDSVGFVVMKGGPILVRIDEPSAKKDRMTIRNFYTAEAYRPDFLKFIKEKAVKVRVIITPSAPKKTSYCFFQSL